MWSYQKNVLIILYIEDKNWTNENIYANDKWTATIITK